MGALKIVVVVALCAIGGSTAASAKAESVADWRAYVAEASVRFAVPINWIEAVMRVESDGRTRIFGRPIRSRAGAIGLMQLMPGTWTEMRAAYRLGSDPDDPHDNILAGAAYLRLMYDRFGYPGLFAAYNAGPGRYADHLVRGTMLPNETRRYLASVRPVTTAILPTRLSGAWNGPNNTASLRQREPRQQLFVSIRPEQVGQEPMASEAATSPLFVSLSRC
jgi:soluble lytic murein transglycosylase-like protein